MTAAADTERPIGIIGVGVIAEAIVEGLSDGTASAPPILLSPRGATTARALAARYGNVEMRTSNAAVVEGAALIVLATRPEQAAAALRGLPWRADHLVVSLMAGVDLTTLRPMVGGTAQLVRALPLPAVRSRRSITVTHPEHATSTALFARLGGALPVADEADFDVYWALSATMSSHFGIVAAISDWAVDRGIAAADAQTYVRALFRGLAEPLDADGRTAAQLVDDHETPGGLNAQLRREWLLGGGADGLRDALDGVLARVRAR